MHTFRISQTLLALGVLLGVLFTGAACTNRDSKTAQLTLQFRGPQMPARSLRRSRHPSARTVAPTIAQMDCLLLNVRGEGIGETFSGKTFLGDVSASCLQLGTVSKAVTLSTATSTGINLRVKPGASRKIEVLGYYGGLGASCADKSFEQLMEQSGSNPQIFLLGSQDLNVTADATFTIANTYDSSNAASADRVAACASTTAVTGAKIFSWNGTAYTDIGLTANSVDALYWDAGSNSLYVGGDFQDAGGNANADYVAKYDATTSAWFAVTTSGQNLNGRVRSIAKGGGSNLYVGGDFTDAGGNAQADGFIRIAGGTTAGLDSVVGGTVYALSYVGSNVYVGGDFTDIGGNTQLAGLAEFRETNSTFYAPGSVSIGSGSEVYSLYYDSTYFALYMGGSFTSAGGVTGADNVAYFAGGAYYAAGAGLNGPVYAFTFLGSDIYATGNFTQALSGSVVNYIASFYSTAWSPVVTGVGAKGLALTTLGSDIFAGGTFTSIPSVSNAKHIARFDGADWLPLGNGLNGDVTVLSEGPSRIFIGGNFSAEN